MAHPETPRPGAPSPIDARTSGQLVGALSDQVSRLVKDEIALATADVKAKASKLAAGSGLLAGAAVLALCMVVALLVAAGLGFALIVSSWLAALIMAAIFLFVAAVLGVPGHPAGQARRAAGAQGSHRRTEDRPGDREAGQAVTDDKAVRTPAQIRADIAATRIELEETVDALSAKLDIKSRAQGKATQVRAYLTDPGNRPQVAAGVVAVVALVALAITRSRRSS